MVCVRHNTQSLALLKQTKAHTQLPPKQPKLTSSLGDQTQSAGSIPWDGPPTSTKLARNLPLARYYGMPSSELIRAAVTTNRRIGRSSLMLVLHNHTQPRELRIQPLLPSCICVCSMIHTCLCVPAQRPEENDGCLWLIALLP